jgi:DegV family protein with EDD domain
MIGRTAVVTDSASYLPDEVRRRFGVFIVPLVVTIDGRDYREGVDLDAADFYPMLQAAASVTTSQPSPGAVLEVYRAAAAAGAREIVSVHVGASLSGTVQSAMLAAASSPVPVTVVDSGQASFAEGLVVWAVLEALSRGRAAADAPEIAARASGRIGNTFVVEALDALRRGGRLEPDARAESVPVLALTGGRVRVTGQAGTIDDAVSLMAETVAEAAAAARGGLRVGIGHGGAEPIACELRRRVKAMAGVAELIEYVVGPSIGAHTGAGNAGAVFIDRALDEL